MKITPAQSSCQTLCEEMYNLFKMKRGRWLSKLLLAAALLFSGCTSSGNSGDEETYAARVLPDLYSEYVYLEDADTGQVLIDTRSEEQMYPASMTKLMTGIVAIEHISDLSETYTITNEIMSGLIEASANRAGFLAGDSPTLEDLLYGTLLPSGAECARALAFYVSGSEEAFVDLMNEKAQELGMTGTHFVNTTGLHDDDHYSTCRDMAILMNYCMQNEEMIKILSTEYHTSVAVKHYPNGLGMENGVLQYINQTDPKYQNFDIPGFVCGKSGYTLEGLYTLASYATESNMNLILVDCHGYKEQHYPASIADAASIYNWFAEHYSRQTVYSQGDELTTVRVRDSSVSTLKVTCSETVTMDLPNDDNLHVVLDFPDTVEAGTKKGDPIGTLKIYDYDQLVYSQDYYAEEDCPQSFMGTVRTVLYEHAAWISLIGLGLIVLILALGNYHPKKKKKRIHSTDKK